MDKFNETHLTSQHRCLLVWICMMLNLYPLLSKSRVLNRGREYRCNKDTERCIGQGQCKYTDIFIFMHHLIVMEGFLFTKTLKKKSVCIYLYTCTRIYYLNWIDGDLSNIGNKEQSIYFNKKKRTNIERNVITD